MAGTPTIFREIHRLRKHAKDLQAQIDRVPVQTKAQQAKVARAEDALKNAKAELMKLKVKTNESEGALRSTHQLVAKHQKQLNEAAGKKEYDALQTEIAAEMAKCAQLEEEVLTHMGEIEEQTAALPALEQAIVKAREEYAKFEKDSAVRKEEHQQMLAAALQQLKEVETTLPTDALPLYQRLVQGRGADAMAPVQNQSCGACSTSILSQQQNDLLSGRVAVCKSCDRLLYLMD